MNLLNAMLLLTRARALHEVAVVLLPRQIDGPEGDGRDAAAHLRAHPHVVLGSDLKVVVRVIHCVENEIITRIKSPIIANYFSYLRI